LFPRVAFTPPSTVVLGKPSAFAVGQISLKWTKSHRVVLVREQGGFYALRAVCTHLGCIPNWQPQSGVFECPCHGSAFRKSGVNISGPAPRPLERLGIFLDDGGRVVVDTALRLRKERGEWEREIAYLRYAGGEGDGPA
jgi:cytochrome b6-f complex iron-sulfur subunit